MMYFVQFCETPDNYMDDSWLSHSWCNLFDSTDPYKERSVDPFDFCNKFAPQGSDYYTYNDYYSFLSRQQ